MQVPLGHCPADDGGGRGGEAKLKEKSGKHGPHGGVAHVGVDEEAPHGYEGVGQGALAERKAVPKHPVRQTW